MNTLKLIQLVSAASLVALSLTTSTEPIVTVDTDTQVIKEISRKTSRPNLWGLLPAAALGASALGFIGKDDDSEDDPKPTAKRRKVSVPVSTDSDIEDGDEDELDAPIVSPAWTPALAPITSAPPRVMTTIEQAAPSWTEPDQAPWDEPISTPVEVAPTVTNWAAKYGATIAEMTDITIPAHRALLSKTRMGKTVTLTAMMTCFKERYPDAEIYVLDIKGSSWPSFVTEVCNPGMGKDMNTSKVVQMVEKIFDKMSRRSKGIDSSRHPILFIADEWNRTFNTIKQVSRLQKTDDYDLITMAMGDITMMSLEYKVFYTLVVQETQCDKIGLSDDGRVNISWYALARGEDTEMVDKAIGSKSKLISSPEKSKSLRGRFNKAWHSPSRVRTIPIIVGVSSDSVEYVPDFTALMASLSTPHAA